jgi:very-short-patch-repair endonuclease
MHKVPQDPIPDSVDASAELPRTKAAEFILGMVEGSILALDGIDSEGLRVVLDAAEPDRCGKRALFARIAPAPTAEAIVDQALNLLAETARRLWPLWFTDVSFAGCRNDRLGRLAVDAIARSAAKEIAGLSPSWAAAAARLALDSHPPRVRGALPAVELAQLTRAINRSGLVLIADVSVACAGPNPAAMVHALEWTAQHSRGAVVALFAELPPNEPPFDRILYGARRVSATEGASSGVVEAIGADPADAAPWIAPWRGKPHPLSDIERRLAQALSVDRELASLFGFNLIVETARGSHPKVDLLWPEGRLVVEIDGWGVHGNRAAFMYDRHRDYELIVSGYTVLRLANDEIAQDVEKAVEKIRDVARLCRARARTEV